MRYMCFPTELWFLVWPITYCQSGRNYLVSANGDASQHNGKSGQYGASLKPG